MMREKCQATIVFGDDEGNNYTTFHCGLEVGHTGLHCETGDKGFWIIPMPYTLTWKYSQQEMEEMLEKQLEEAK